MTKSLDSAIEQIQKYALSIDGVNAAPTDPIESMNVFPFCVSYPESGSISTESANAYREIHLIYTEIHIKPVILADAVKTGIRILREFSRKIEGNPQLNETVDSIIFPITYQFGSLEWGKEKHIGFRFLINVKLRGSIS